MVAGVCVLAFLSVAFLIGSFLERVVPARVWNKMFKLFGYQPEEG